MTGTAALLFKKIRVFGGLLSWRKGPCGSQACLPDLRAPSPSPDPRCSLFIPASLNEFITLWGSTLPKCNVLLPLSAKSLNWVYIYYFDLLVASKRGFFSGPLCGLLCFPAERRDQFFFTPLSFLKVCFKGLTRKQAPGEYWIKKNQLGHGLVEIWGTAVWRSERKKVPPDDWSGKRKCALTKFVLVFSLKWKLWVYVAPKILTQYVMGNS